MSDATTSHLDSFPGGVIDWQDGQVCAFNQAAKAWFPALTVGAPLPPPLSQLLCAPQQAGQFVHHTAPYQFDRIPVGDHVLLHLRPAASHALTEQQLEGIFRALRGHLQTILASVQTLAQNIPPSVDSPEELQAFYKSFCRIERLLSNRQLCQALEQPGALPFHPRPIEFASLVRQLAMEAEGLLEQVGIRLDYRQLPPTLLLPGDPHLLSRLVLTLLSNAVKQTPTGGTITIALNMHNTAALLTIQDGAPASRPIPLDVLLAEGTPERTIPSPQDGAGMGLQLARTIVALHGGKMEPVLSPNVRFQWRISLPTAPLPTQLRVQQPPSNSSGFPLVLVELSDVLPASCFSSAVLD